MVKLTPVLTALILAVTAVTSFPTSDTSERGIDANSKRLTTGGDPISIGSVGKREAIDTGSSDTWPIEREAIDTGSSDTWPIGRAV